MKAYVELFEEAHKQGIRISYNPKLKKPYRLYSPQVHFSEEELRDILENKKIVDIREKVV